MAMNIALALIPSVLWGVMALLLGAFPTDPRRQNTMVLLGAGTGSILAALLLGAPWYGRSLVWGIVCGLMWTGGQIFMLRAYMAWGVALTQPLTSAMQLSINAMLGIVLFGEWRAPGAMPLGLAALLLISIGGTACSWQEKAGAGPGPDAAARRRGLISTTITSVLYGSYASVLREVEVPSEHALGPMGIGVLLGAVLTMVVLPRREPIAGPRRLPAFGAGAVWCLGNALMLWATGKVGVATGFTLSQLGFIVATLGALLILHEHRSRKELKATAAGIVVALLGLGMLGAAASL